ncbi:3-oxoacyl-(acyl-carrier-protein) synthase III protein 1 [Granulicella tundricola MP5ACTX9]|uniref:3-oxoacyl-(Acyl-carrier-protein) synthase III protein 1 n=1 Tax=Granulicella tundricola (strain ATCC BAA-1859 / DSM 23138 / MP5ACTX9) TaxID=1198114 RepID=E8X1I6_GRATM|nr:3-oxoacyl-(acyl-carrier-protein) synthase III protein 1 [Granulicella tundricola MP5ACTX9]
MLRSAEEPGPPTVRRCQHICLKSGVANDLSATPLVSAIGGSSLSVIKALHELILTQIREGNVTVLLAYFV